MKYVFFGLSILVHFLIFFTIGLAIGSFFNRAFAATSYNHPVVKILVYTYRDQTFEVRIKNVGTNEAIRVGARECMSYMKTQFGKLTDEAIYDIAVTCANPQISK